VGASAVKPAEAVPRFHLPWCLNHGALANHAQILGRSGLQDSACETPIAKYLPELGRRLVAAAGISLVL
jgi:hypothetical protein